MKEVFIAKSPAETWRVAKILIEKITKKKAKRNKALIFILEGELGAGKTEFIKGVAKALKIKEKINSPTFVILKRFKIKNNPFAYLWHFDLYRIKKPKELFPLGFKEIIGDKNNLIFIEWGNKIKKILPQDFKIIKIKILKERQRLIEINY